MLFAVALGVLLGAAFVVLIQQLVDNTFVPARTESTPASLPRPTIARPRGVGEAALGDRERQHRGAA